MDPAQQREQDAIDKVLAAEAVESAQGTNVSDITLPKTSKRVIAFYYPWYGNPEVNGEWMHWNHKILVENGAIYEPPESIGANFYPLHGTYSSADPALIETHMREMSEARIGVICISWWGKSNADSQLLRNTGYTDSIVPVILDTARRYNIQVCFHHEPYEGRKPSSVRTDLQYINEKYGKHPAYFRDPDRGNRPMFFVYDAYLTPEQEWSTILSPTGAQTIRGSDFDAVMIALYVESPRDQSLALNGGFDGVYTYFAAVGFTPGSTPTNWPNLAAWTSQHGKAFIPSVGPGYDDTRIRPWNKVNKRDREQGQYYDRMWSQALDVKPAFISITSWNEWHEGTQIEAAVPKEIAGFKYSDYTPLDPEYYLRRTLEHVNRFDPVS